MVPKGLAGGLSTSGQGREISMTAANWQHHTETGSVEKYLPDLHSYQKGLKLLKGREGWELESAEICSNTGKNDLLRSA